MRTEQEMFQLILSTAQQDDRIRAVAMNGSRTNPNVPTDIFQDYDIVYLVTELDSFLLDPNWVEVFGDRIVMQTPDTSSIFPHQEKGRFAYLMQFADGNRIDLSLRLLSQKEEYIKEDRLVKVLLDKDTCLPELPAPTDQDYWVKRPSAQNFADCCNEFWWVAPYVAKGLWRKEFLFAREHLDTCLREMTIMMLGWQVGTQTDFSVSIGKCGKYLEKYLPAKQWQSLLATYTGGSCEETWKGLFALCEVFMQSSGLVAGCLGYSVPPEEHSTYSFLHHIYKLGQDMTEIY